MSDELSDGSPSGSGRSGAGLPGLDLDRLRSYLDRELPGLVSGPLDGRVIAGGKSNLTYVVTDGTGSWVVRRPPLGHVLATAHDMPREYRVMTALRDTSVPVPRTHLLCEDTDVLGAPFYVSTESFLPVAAALHTSGMGLGAVFALVISAAGVNLPELALLARLMRPSLLAAYVTAVVGMAITAGYLIPAIL